MKFSWTFLIEKGTNCLTVFMTLAFAYKLLNVKLSNLKYRTVSEYR